jgi:intracellular multiplication protein IcmK
LNRVLCLPLFAYPLVLSPRLTLSTQRGAPWPIASYGIGDPQAFNIQWDQHSNTLFIQSLRVYSHGNMAIKLKDLDTPIMISLVSGQREVDFRVDFQVAGRGPQATAPILPQSMTTPAQVNPMLINFLDGIPPQGSTKLDAGRYGDAWIYQNKMYFRSKLKLLSPAWMATLSSPDGTHVYEMMKTPLILATENGVTVHIVLKGM